METGIVRDGSVGIGSVRDGFVGAGSKPARESNEPAPTENAMTKSSPTTELPEIVRQLKTFSAKRINIERKTPGKSVWQRNYYEHIVRDEKSLYFIRKYIRENPLKWIDDSENHIDREIDYFQMEKRGSR